VLNANRTFIMIDSVMFWNEPNNKSHWDFEIDPEWEVFAEMVSIASHKVKKISPGLLTVLGGISPIDARFIKRLDGYNALDAINVLAVHGFPLDWDHWQIHDWPSRIAEIREVAKGRPVWVSEAGVSTFGAEEVQLFGLQRTAELLIGQVPRIHWYSLYDLPKEWPTTTRHREAEGSSYYRHFYMGLLREDGSAKISLKAFKNLTPELGICQWFHFEDPRLDDAVCRLRDLGVVHLRTGLSWADSFRPGAEEWFDRQMEALKDFKVTITFCCTPEHRGVVPHHTSPPLDLQEYADFCCRMVERYAQHPGSPSLPVEELGLVPA